MTNVLKKIKSNDATQSWRLQEKLVFLLFSEKEDLPEKKVRFKRA